MTIKITKSTIEVDHGEFYTEIKSICQQIQKFNKSQIGAKYPVFKRALGLKTTELEFFNLCENKRVYPFAETLSFLTNFQHEKVFVYPCA